MVKRANPYYRHSKISTAKFRQILRCFSLDLTATDTAHLTGISVRSTNTIFLKIRHRLAEACQREAFIRGGEVEVDESYFGPRRRRGKRGRGKRGRGKRGRGASGKTIVFGIFEREGRVYTEIVPNAKKRTLQSVIRGHVAPEVVMYSDGWVGYDGLVDMGYKKHFRIRHRDEHFANGRVHINGIEAFWSYAKRRLAKFCGVSSGTFLLHLKECEWRFNHRRVDTYRALLKLLRDHPL